MEIKIEHFVALAVVGFLAFTAGKRRTLRELGQGGAVTDANRTTNTAQWWSYAGSWQQ